MKNDPEKGIGLVDILTIILVIIFDIVALFGWCLFNS